MTNSSNPQRRDSDRWKSEASNRNGTIAALAVVFAGAWWVGGQAAEEKILPTRDIAMKNSTIVDVLVIDMASIKSDIKELLKLSKSEDK